MPGRRESDLYTRYEKRVRDGLIFTVGIVGVINELFLVAEPRPSSLIFLASLIGVPFVLGADEKRTRKNNGDSEQASK